MNHPFDDFLPPAWHTQRSDRRIVRIGLILAAVVSIATAAAFATTLNGWRTLLKDQSSVATEWSDAQERAQAYLRAQKDLQDSITSAASVEQLTDGVPRSVLLYELTSALPEEVQLSDIRLETNRRILEDDSVQVAEKITLIGDAKSDTEISEFIDHLSSSPYLANVTLMYAQEDLYGSRRSFSLHVLVQPSMQLSMETSE